MRSPNQTYQIPGNFPHSSGFSSCISIQLPRRHGKGPAPYQEGSCSDWAVRPLCSPAWGCFPHLVPSLSHYIPHKTSKSKRPCSLPSSQPTASPALTKQLQILPFPSSATTQRSCFFYFVPLYKGKKQTTSISETFPYPYNHALLLKLTEVPNG